MAKPKKSKELCAGCRERHHCINTDYAPFKKAKIVKKVKACSTMPPPFSPPVYVLSCYGENGYVYLTSFDKITHGTYKGQYCYGGDAYYWNYK